MEKYCLRIIQWNCFSLTIARIEELRLFLNEAQPDIMSIQETKLNDEKATCNYGSMDTKCTISRGN